MVGVSVFPPPHAVRLIAMVHANNSASFFFIINTPPIFSDVFIISEKMEGKNRVSSNIVVISELVLYFFIYYPQSFRYIIAAKGLFLSQKRHAGSCQHRLGQWNREPHPIKFHDGRQPKKQKQA